MTHAIALPPAAGLAALTDLQRVYFGYLADYGPRTRKAYEYHLNAYLTWCGHNQIDPLTADRTHVALYVRHLSEERGLRGSTVNTCMTPVKGFYRWAMLEGFIDRDPVVHTKLPKSDYRQKHPIDREELRAIRRAGKEIGGRVADEGGISRPALTKWYKRWLTYGEDGLQDRTSRPEHSPTATPSDIEDMVVQVRVHEKWGADRISGFLATVGAGCASAPLSDRYLPVLRFRIAEASVTAMPQDSRSAARNTGRRSTRR